MQALFQKLIARAGNMIDPERQAEGMPPDRLRAFMTWALQGGWLIIWLGVAISALAGVTEVLSMYLLGRVVDAVGGPVQDGFLSDHMGLIALAVGILLVARPLLFGGLALTQSVMIGPNIFKLVLARLYRWTIGQSVTFFDDDYAGRIAQKMVQAARSLTEIVIETVNAVTFGLATIIGTAVLLAAIHPGMLLLLAGWFALYLAFLRVMLPIIRRRSAARAEAQAMVTGQVVDTISNIKTVKLFAGDMHEDRRALGEMENLRGKTLDFGEATTAFRLGLIFIAGMLPVIMVGTAIAMRSAGVSPGDIAAVGAVTIRLAQMTGWISFTLMVIYGHVGEVEDGMTTLSVSHALTDKPGATDLQVSEGEITFDDVHFAYGGRTGGVSGIDLTIHPGEKLAIVGASGAGKSTLLSLLLRLYDSESGQVRIDGTDVSGVTQTSLRSQIGMVTQETAMFNRSALDNIRYGRPGATEAEVIEAAKRAEAHEFILELEDFRGRTGYGAYLGERGVKLSGGQRQRIALARAILKDAPILVLDEATSALDSEVEAAIQEALGRVMEGKTVLAIAHRLSTISSMDRIVVLHEGRIAEQGTHDELLEKKGLYARYWDRQSGGFLGEDAVEAAE
ncbi:MULTISPECIES: ABC transporter ATP-binding protein [Mameliella]|uniref:ABC transporter ATP-binding protein n=1 Tax=Mameliella TaxID=1434019 RepID=UPI000B538664|nr:MULTISPECIES: ABC transporter ATP-binding protein [Mameliella]MCR9273177.1 ABC transporter ATP-binding protein/permease [Paracoccaceae bacterium]OWV56199.1 multidrug ABC transporter ATP-binding protein [Mameliella alba]